MIKLHSRHRVVAAADGSVRTLDVDALRRELRRAFHSCGITEDWTADHIALVIEEHASGNGAHGAALPERDLHAMVSALLSASGYEDVGRHYLGLLPQGARPDEADPFRPWDPSRVEAELAGMLPVSGAERQRIVARASSALAGMGFDVVTSALIRELGRHALQQVVAGPAPEAMDSPWVLLPGQWPIAAVPGAGALHAASVLHLHPVSRFLPRLRIQLDLRRLATTIGTLPLPEITYLPGVARAVGVAAGLLTAASQCLAARLPSARTAEPHMVVTALDQALAEALLPHSAREAKAIKAEVRAIVGARLQGAGFGDVLVTFR